MGGHFRWRWSPVWGAILLLLLGGCASQPPATPAAPGTALPVSDPAPAVTAVTVAAPRVPDAHELALRRQLTEPYQRRTDRDDQLLVPIADRDGWRRSRFFLVDHFTGFRYGEDVHALNIVFVQDVPEGQTADVKTCMQQFERWAQPQLDAYAVKVGPVTMLEVPWRKKAVLVRMSDSRVDYGQGEESFSTAWAAYPAYPKACLIFALAVPWRGHRDLAEQVRERWVNEGLRRLGPKTKTRPYRKAR